MNLCSACGEDFGGVQAFDRHRVGSHAYLASPSRPGGRRCISRDELLERGFWKNSRGRWSLPGSRQAGPHLRRNQGGRRQPATKPQRLDGPGATREDGGNG